METGNQIELNNKDEKFFNILVVRLCRFDTFCGTRTESQNLTEEVNGDHICTGLLVDKGRNYNLFVG